MSYTTAPFIYDPKICQLSYNNSFKFGYNNQWFNFRESSEDKWHCGYSKISRPIGNFRQECVETAKLIRESTDLKIDVLYSGGRDSEAVVESFLEAGIPFNVVILEFEKGINAHDIVFAKTWCQARDIKPTILRLDIEKFYEQAAYDYAKDIYCVNALILPHYWAADQCDGYVVIGSGDIIIVKNIFVDEKDPTVPWIERKNMGWDWSDKNWVYDQKWYVREGEAIAANYRHFMKTNRSACPAFFQFNPEIMLAHMLEPEIQNIQNDNKSVSAWNAKYELYHRLWNMPQRQKYDGLEKLWVKTILPTRLKLEALYPNSRQYHRTEVNEFIDILKVHNDC